jgi:hypothetical protein
MSADAYPTADGGFAYDPPPAGAVAFPATDPTSHTSALAFSLRAPVRFLLGHGFDVTLQLQADKPLVARDQEGNAIELSLLMDGAPVSGAPMRVPLSAGPLLAPGDRASAHAVLQAPSAVFAKGANLTLLVRTLLPAVPEGALEILVGPGGSWASLDSMRIPSIEDLELEDGDFTVYLPRNASFAPSDARSVAHAVRVGHASVDFASIRQTDGKRVYLVFVGEEPIADAQANHDFPDRERRLNATHQLMVGGALVRVHPGVAVVVPIGAGPAPVEVACVRNCPAGWRATVTFASAEGASPSSSSGGAAAPWDPEGGLIPPPRSTNGIPVSGDAPAAEKRVPAPQSGAAFAVAALAALHARHRSRSAAELER